MGAFKKLQFLRYSCSFLVLGMGYYLQMMENKTLKRHLTNRPHFSMVHPLIDRGNDVIKCSKLKKNHELQSSSFTAKFWTFYGIISIVYGKPWKVGIDLFFTITFIFMKNQKQNNRHCIIYVISMVYTLIDHSSRPISVRGFVQLL